MEKSGKRYTIGVITPNNTSILASYIERICTAFLNHSEKYTINIVLYYGYSFNTVNGTWYQIFDSKDRQQLTLYDFVNKQNLDGVVVLTNNLYFFLKEEQINAYFKQFSKIPVISFGLEVDRVPSIIIDNKEGIKDTVGHLNKVHGCQKIAFIKGPEVNIEAAVRYEAYLENLEELGIPFDPALITKGHFIHESGVEAVKTLLDERKVKVDAIIGCNDECALGAVYELYRRRIRVPHDICVTGFDNCDASALCVPPLTTVNQPLEEMAEIAVNLLLKSIAGETIPLVTTAKTSLITRNSCGCLSQTVLKISNDYIIDKTSLKELITTAVKGFFSQEYYKTNRMLIESLIDYLHKKEAPEAETITQENILSYFYQLLTSSIYAGRDFTKWHEVLTLIENQLTDQEVHSHKTVFLGRARAMLAELAEAKQGKMKNDFFGQNLRLFQVTRQIASHVVLEDLYRNLYEELPKLNITKCYLFLYEPSGTVPVEYSNLQLVFGFDETGKLEVKEKKVIKDTLLPRKIREGKAKENFILSTILFGDESLGFIAFDIKEMSGITFETLSQQIATAVKTARIFKERKEAEIELKRANEQLVATNEKLKEMDRIKTQFFANISHELRTPLTLILGPLESLYEGEYGDSIDSKNTIIKSALSNGWRLLKLINNLLDFAKLDARKMQVNKEETDLVELIEYYTGIIRSGATQKGLEIFFEHPEGDFTALVDPELVEKIFFNLLSNAIKFTPRGGKITISLEADETNVFLLVADTGIGIPPEKLETIFERFSQVDGSSSRKYEGTGIGLAFSREMAKLLGGTISAASQLGKGALFTLTLPRVSKGQTERAGQIKRKSGNINKINEVDSYFFSNITGVTGLEEEPAEQAGVFPDRKKIVVIDDTKSMRTFLVSILEKEYSVFTAENGRTGLEKTELHLPDLVISDVMMPEVDGIEFVNRLKNQEDLKHIPVLLLTARTDISNRLEGLKCKADDYLTKPFNARELLLRIKNLLANRELQLELVKQHRTILTGLQYARTIQKSILPDFSVIMQNVKDSFVLWKPRDIVGGDFYWFKETPGGFLAAVIDCTGHGIPGAFMTMGAYSELNHIIENSSTTDPASILRELNKSIKISLNQENEEESFSLSKSDEGLDTALCFYDRKQKRLTFAGARRSLYYVQHNKVTIIKGDKQSIGYRTSETDFFYTNHRIDCSDETSFFLTTDGFFDQTNEEGDRLFGTADFQKVLQKANGETMDEQKKLLEHRFHLFKGRSKQIDDITIFAFKI